MNKNLWYGIGVVVIVVIIIFVVAGSSGSPKQQAQPVTAVVARQTMHDLIVSGVSQTCTFSIPATASSSSLSGTIYLAGGNMQGDFVKTDPENKITNAHVVVADNVGYIWSDQSSGKGYKMAWSLMASSTVLSSRPEGVDLNQPTAYDCKSWVTDQTKFTPPTTVKFTDISAFMKKAEKV